MLGLKKATRPYLLHLRSTPTHALLQHASPYVRGPMASSLEGIYSAFGVELAFKHARPRTNGIGSAWEMHQTSKCMVA
jgi:hypothetical protein